MLGQLQREFAHCVGLLIVWAYAQPGYALAFGEALRPEQMAAIYAEQGIGINPSVHMYKLAVDFMLFIGGVYQTDSLAYTQMGTYWKSLHPLARWGGDFKDAEGKPKPDGDHFSFEWQGIK